MALYSYVPYSSASVRVAPYERLHREDIRDVLAQVRPDEDEPRDLPVREERRFARQRCVMDRRWGD